MSESGEDNIYPAGSISKEQRIKEMPLINQKIKSELGAEWLFLNEIAKPKEPDLMVGLEVAARLHIRDLHKDAGVELKELPFVFVVPEEKWDEACRKLGTPESKGVAGFVLFEGTAVAVKENDDLLVTAHNMYHEMMHAVGKVATVVTPGRYESRQQGYRTMGKNEKRGKALEEGVAEFFATEFVLNSTFDGLFEAREETSKVMWPEKALDKDYQRAAVQLKLNSLAPDSYFYSHEMVITLIRAGGRDMWDLLLAARIDGSKIAQLVKKINESFGDKDAARKVFQTQFDNESVIETSNWLKERLVKKLR